jgi:hypothetical protein
MTELDLDEGNQEQIILEDGNYQKLRNEQNRIIQNSYRKNQL